MQEENIYTPSEGELEILQILWEQEPATVRSVHEQLSQHKEVVYTTTLKQIQRLLEKGILTRTEVGKVHFYRTAVQKDQIQQTLFQRIVNTAFQGSAIELAMHALRQSQPSVAELQMLEKMIQEKKKAKDHE